MSEAQPVPRITFEELKVDLKISYARKFVGNAMRYLVTLEGKIIGMFIDYNESRNMIFAHEFDHVSGSVFTAFSYEGLQLREHPILIVSGPGPVGVFIPVKMMLTVLTPDLVRTNQYIQDRFNAALNGAAGGIVINMVSFVSAVADVLGVSLRDLR